MADKNDFKPDSIAALAAVAHLVAIAKTNSGQARRVGDFLLAWLNAEENGGWNTVDLWQLDVASCNHKRPGSLFEALSVHIICRLEKSSCSD